MGQQHLHESALRKGRWSWPNHCYFVTTNAADKQPIFAEPSAAHVIIDSLRWLQEQGRIQLMRFVVMPDHVHVTFVLCSPCQDLSQVMNSFKGYTGKKINELYGRQGDVWQPTYHDHLVRDRRDFETRLAYMHANPVRKGLVEFEHEYFYSTTNSEYSHLVDWAWLDGIEAGRAWKGAPTMS
jgi:REP-associated tyrosine transposase